MSDTPINDTLPEDTESAPQPEEKGYLPPSEDPDDPLNRLRQSLLDEETKKQEEPKPAGFFKRVASGLKGKKNPPTPASEEPSTAPRFGVQTAFEPIFPATSSKSSIIPAPAQEEELQDEFLEKRLGTGPLSQDWRRSATSAEPTAEETENTFDQEAGEFLSGTRAAADRIQSPFSTRIVRSSGLQWGDEESEANPEESQVSGMLVPPAFTPEKAESSYPYAVEEKKTQASNADRKTQPGPFIAYQPSTSFGQKLRSISPLERVLLIVLMVAVIGVITMLGFFYAQSRTPAVVEPVKTALPTATPAGVPIPVNLRLTGGWNFPLQRSTMVKGKWVPAGSEWLEGTEIRRVVGIPWNKQTEAVIQSMATNDKIELVMNNGDILNYRVQSVGQVPAQDTSILYDTKPSLIIVLMNPDDVNRWVVIAYP